MDIFIKNENDFDHADRFDGQDYFFPKGERVTVPVIAARHMFGYGDPDKTETLIRLGWANEANDAGARKLANFIFTRGVMVEEVLDSKQPQLGLLPEKTTVRGEMAPVA